MKVYVVTEGSYSDYCIVCVTLDKEKADFIASKHGDGVVEEYDTDEVDVQFEHKNDTLYFVSAEACDLNDPYLINESDIKIENRSECWSTRAYDAFKDPSWVKDFWSQRWTMYCFAKSEDEAKKIFFDRLAQVKAKAAGL